MIICMLYKILKWTPRVLVIILIAFFLLMSFDVFTEDYKWYEMALGFFMHNIPTLLIAASLWVAWTKPRIGGYIYLILCVTTVFFFNTAEHIESFMASSLPLFIIGMLFVLNPNIDSAKLKQSN
jgi:hypothetical protein